MSDLIERISPCFSAIAGRARVHDREASFPFESVEDLRAAGYLAAPVPAEYGGLGAPLAEVAAAQRALAKVDMSLAFAVGMHLMSVGSEAANRAWPDALRERIFRSVVAEGALLNQVATEPELGSPQGGGRPQTTLTPCGEGRYRIDGRKSFTTLAPDLTWFLTYTAVEDGSGGLARVAVHRDSPGLRIEETWDVVGLRSTGSHDVWFEGVEVAEADILIRQDPKNSGQRGGGFCVVRAARFGRFAGGGGGGAGLLRAVLPRAAAGGGTGADCQNPHGPGWHRGD